MENNEFQGIQDEELEAKQKGFDFDVQAKREQLDLDFDNKQRNQAFDFDMRQRNMELDFDMKQREVSIKREDDDLAFQRKRQSLFDQDEIDARKDQRQSEMADKESRRRQEELEAKGNIAMRNMQAMMEAKRAARQDELQHEKEMQQARFEAEERRMQTQKEMTAEQIMAAQIREMDAGAQAKFAESFSAGKDAERERQVAEEKVQMQQQMMSQMMEMAKMGFQANATVAAGKIDALRERLAASSPTPPPATPEPEKSNPIRLNTSWLREHGYEGSFNELAGYLHNLGAGISQDYDNQGNPVIVVEGLSQAQVMDVLEKSGVKF